MNFWELKSAKGSEQCLVGQDSEISYEELAALSDSIYPRGKRSIVLMLCDRNKETIAGYLGALRNGYVPVMMPRSLDGISLTGYSEVYRPRYAWLPRADVALLSNGADKWREVGALLDYVLMELPVGGSDYRINEDLALLMPTSGSTGDPKLVRLSYDNLQANALAISEYLKLSGSDAAITSLPLNYSYGLSVLNSHLAVGARVVVTAASVLERGFWDAACKRGVTSIAGVPYTFEMLRRMRPSRHNLPSLRFLTQAGGHMRSELTEEFLAISDANGWQFYTMYGQTEATARIAYMPPDCARAKLGSVGLAIPGGSVGLVPAPGHDAAADVGELVYSGPNVCMGYAHSVADLARGDDNRGVLRTGDLARIDEEGFIFILGRLRRYAKIYGNNVSLDHIEAILREGGLDCMVTADGDQLKIYCCFEEGPVFAVLKGRLSLPVSAIQVFQIDEFPLNSNGKRNYKALSAKGKEQ